jgi:uncharacterized protein YacL
MPGNPLTDPKWADEMTNTVVTTVRTIREKTTVPLVYAARGVVFGLLAAILGLVALVLLVIMLLRGLQALLDLAVSWERAVYLSYLILGALFSLVALVLFKKRNANAG